MLNVATPLLERVSLTGADDAVSIADLARLSEQYPFVEWALLYVPHRQGVPRNPSQSWRQDFFEAQLPGYSAVHLCGRLAFEELLLGTLPAEVLKADRLQLNINARKPDFTDSQVLDVFRRAMELGPEIILQYHTGSAALIQRFLGELGPDDRTRAHVLLDESKGTGRVLGSVCAPPELDGVYCGFAGGLGPENISRALSAIELGGREYWADMESGIRTDNRFDLEKVRLVLEAGQAARS